MPVPEPTAGEWREEFDAVLEQIRSRASPLTIADRDWQLAIAEGRPLIRICIESRWSTLPLDTTKWSRGRRDAYQRIASGNAFARELIVSLRREVRRPQTSVIVCKTVAWLPRKQLAELAELQGAPGARSWNIQDVDIGRLRKAIRMNEVGFPSQIPTFLSAQPDLEAKAVQLYFVMGWSCASIAVRYGLTKRLVRSILNTWKVRAANAGYLQHIPPAWSAGSVKAQLAAVNALDRRSSN